MHGRRAAELAHQLRRAALARISRREREYRALRERLESHDLRRRMAAIRGRLQTADGRLSAAAARSRDRADTRFRVLAGRLDNLSPLAVLARGYAVCWNEDRTSIIRTQRRACPSANASASRFTRGRSSARSGKTE